MNGERARLIAVDEIAQWKAGRYVTPREEASPERYALYRLCECAGCEGTGKEPLAPVGDDRTRCADCRGEGRTRDLIATCATPEAIGVALVTLGREGEWEGCPLGLLDTEGEKGERWLIRPWLPSARNISDAGRTLRQAQQKEKT